MAKFVLIDHSLIEMGGHHYEYDYHILCAAEAAGFEPVLAANLKLGAQHQLPRRWKVFPLFRYGSYLKYAVFVDPSHPPLNPFLRRARSALGMPSLQPSSLLRRLRAWKDHLRQRKRLRWFGRACGTLFRHVELAAGDHILVPTVSEFDLVGLMRFLKRCPAARHVAWHLQFHFPFLEGREPEYAQQVGKIERMREHFASLLDDASRNRVRFYSTTDLVAAQYNRLGVADFGLLPYPVSPSFRPVVGCDSQQRPLRVVCAGNAREEQGPHHLEQIVRDLWADQLTTGRMQLLVQAGPHLRLPFPPGASEAHLDPTTQAPLLSPAPIVRVSHPLTPERYVDLIRSADIGLFLYDSYRYFTRCSGILVEMLCSGVPVIVPAGCWLAEEIAESIYRHLDQLTEHLPTVARMAVPVPRQAGFPDPVTRLTASVEAVTCGRGPAGLMSEVCVPAGATEVLASFRWLRRQDTGHYLRLECEQLDRRGHLLGCAATIVGQRATQAAVPALFHLGSGVERIRLCWENAYLDARVAIGDMNLRFLSAAESGGSCPSGSAGLIAADPQQIPRLLREMAIHHAHYRQSARQFSQGYGRLHDPRNTLQLLVAEVRRVAAA